MKWITRNDAHVDRIACPWLIKKFVDPDADFIYVPAEEVARHSDAIPYDVKGAKLGHADGRCSFESIIHEYKLSDPALEHLAKIVHGADVAQDIALTPESAGLKAIADGFALLYGTRDHAKLAAESPVYDALYEWCRQNVASG
jgi:hypothetical protein